MAPWTATTRENGKGKKLTRLRGVSPPSTESNLLAPYYLRGPVLGETSATNFSGTLFFGAFDSLYFRGLEKGKRQRESWEGAAVNQTVFAIRSSILNRMSFLAGFAELGRLAARPYGSCV
jgi:hypothetical protein